MNDHKDVSKIQEVLQKHHLKVNTDKTEYTLVRRDEEAWKSSKKVGSLLGDKEDIQRRKDLSMTSLNRLNKIWYSNNRVKIQTKLEIYKTLTKSILLYNCGT